MTFRTMHRDQRGFTMIVALGVMLVTGLLMAAVFVATNSEVTLSHQDTLQKQAYYAALSGVQEYEYKLESNPNYWQTCQSPAADVPQRSDEHYELRLLGANGHTSCSTSEPFASMIESKGALANTFRIESIGCAGKAEMTSCEKQPSSKVAVRKVVATFQVTGFLQYVYFTQYETRDPGLYEPKANCAVYRNAGRSSECTTIWFVSGDTVKGPMHTDDSSAVCGTPEFGRAKHTPPDVIEINGGLYTEGCGGGANPVFNSATKNYTVGAELVAPESDTSMKAYVESANNFAGVTRLTLNGTTNKIAVTNQGKTTEINWPENGLIYVENNGSCGYHFTGNAADGKVEKEQETNCGTIYVHGTYSKSLTLAAQNDLVINGNTYPTSVAGKLGSEPSGTTTLGLIATNYVRIYHPVGTEYEKGGGGECPNGDNYNATTKKCEYQNSSSSCDAPNLSAAQDTTNGWGSQSNIWIYAANLSTSHSFTVDNWNCGEQLGELNVYGAIGQKFRGIVGTGGGGSGTGYIKNYEYDQRLASDEPPYFLQPLNAGWKVARLTGSEQG